MDLLLVFQELVEGDETHTIAALVQAIVVEAADFHTEGATLFSSSHALTGDTIARQPAA